MKKYSPIFCFLFLVLLFAGCTKFNEGFTGTSRIYGTVKHHDDPIPNAIVYIKFKATELPGLNPEDYDESVVADDAGAYDITGLGAGEYYLFGIGYDSSISEAVIGGIPIMIKKDGNEEMTDIPVTE